MTSPRFLQLHFLTSYPGALLNRDDAGLAKRLTYGGAVRTRVSSQCLKRHWRTATDAWSLAATGADLSVRSREVFEYSLRSRLIEALPKTSVDVIDAAGSVFSLALYGEKAADVSKRQALLVGWREIGYLFEVLRGLIAIADSPEAAVTATTAEFFVQGKAKSADESGAPKRGKPKKAKPKPNLTLIRESAGALAAGLEAALFGRMVTSDPSANTDAAIHVAHAFTVHEQESETDYFTVVDDLSEDSGSAGIFDTELTSGLYYGYVVVDVPLLVANITGAPPEEWASLELDRTLPAKVIEHLVHLIATVSPGAKKGSTAPYAFANTVLLEAGSRQPRSLASAFESAVRAPRGSSVSRVAESALFDRLRAVDRAYGGDESRRFLSLTSDTVEGLDGPHSIDALASWAAERVRSATV